MDGIEKDLAGRARVARVPAASPLGRELRQRHGIRGIPTILVFDAAGARVHREAGRPDRSAIVGHALGSVSGGGKS